jgi:hypothetical protein
MGWTFPYGASRAQVIEEITRDQENAAGGFFKTHRKCFKGNTMYALHETGPVGEDGRSRKWIGVYLLQRDSRDGTWGYKDMAEEMHPYYYDCPVSYLDEADEPASEHAKEWRKIVREKAAERASKKPKKGERWSYRNPTIGEVTIVSVRPLHGRAPNGVTYRIKRDNLGERL